MDATVILERIARMNKGTLPPGVLIFRPEKHVDNNLGTSETALLIAEDNTGIEEDTSSKSSGIVAFQALWSYDLIRSTFLLWFIYLANYFTYYGVILLTSELSNGKRRCASVRTHLMQPNSGNLYRDVLVTSLAGIIALRFFLLHSSAADSPNHLSEVYDYQSIGRYLLYFYFFEENICMLLKIFLFIHVCAQENRYVSFLVEKRNGSRQIKW